MVMVVWWRASFAKCVACESQLRRVIARMTVAFRPRLSPARFSELTNRNVTDIFGCLERNGTSRWHRRTCGFGPLRGRGLDAGNGDMPVREAGWTRIGQGCVLPATRNEASAVACTRSEAPGATSGPEDQEGVRRCGLRVHAPGAFCLRAGVGKGGETKKSPVRKHRAFCQASEPGSASRQINI